MKPLAKKGRDDREVPAISVLYVDDEPALLDIGKLYLEEIGNFLVETSTSAVTALEMIRSNNFDVIISDYQMPSMDGIEFLKSLRASGDPIPFILFTGRGREEVVIRALNEGADFYLQKGGSSEPVFVELAHKIRLAFRQRMADRCIRNHIRREAEIINFLPDATFAIDADGVVISWNRAMEDFTGVLAGDVLGKGDYEYSVAIYNERRPLLIDLVLRDDPTTESRYPYILRSGKKLFSEITLHDRNGGQGMLLWFTASPVYDAEGRVIGAIESIRDITERKKYEEDLLFRNLILSTEMECSPDGIVVVNKERKILFYNRKFVDIWGIPEDLMTKKIDEPVLQAVLKNVINSEWLPLPEGSLYPNLIARGSGEAHLAGGNVIEWHTTPIIGQDDRYFGRVWGCRDITERKRAEQALLASEERYRRIVETANEGIWEWNTEYVTTFVNRKMADMLGYSIEEMLGRVVTDFMDPGEIEDTLLKIKNRGQGIDEIYERKFRHRDGSIRWMKVSAKVLMDPDGSFAGSFAMLADITRRKKMELELVRSNEELALAYQHIVEIGRVLGQNLDEQGRNRMSPVPD